MSKRPTMREMLEKKDKQRESTGKKNNKTKIITNFTHAN